MRATDTVRSEAPGRDAGAPGWALAVALDCEHLADPPARLALARVAEVEIGRGPRRAYLRADRRLRIELPDRWASQLHARLTHAGDRWTVEDAGSKNGTRVNGRRVERAELCDGDVLECGGTFAVMRRVHGWIGDIEAPEAPVDALRTLSPALERELARLPKVARARIAVLVRGPSGTGKEILANAVHVLSGRSGPLVSMNCGAVPAALVENELFGSQRGAFSGAENRLGLVRSAEHGTLFLDEIAELPASSQAALLRVLQDGEMAPLGADRRILVDVRIVAATNRPMEELVADGRFRQDLYARLRGYEVRLPPLRERLEDLGLLIASLLERLEPGGPPRTLTRAAARALFLHDWPLHVRELAQVLHAAVAVAAGPEIGADDLRLDSAPPPPEGSDGKDELVALLSKHAGNISAVARALATSRSQVLRLAARHGIDPTAYRR